MGVCMQYLAGARNEYSLGGCVSRPSSPSLASLTVTATYTVSLLSQLIAD